MASVAADVAILIVASVVFVGVSAAIALLLAGHWTPGAPSEDDL